MNRTESEWIRTFSELGAFWLHHGSPSAPHALLTKGGHSNGFFNWSIVASKPWITSQVASDLHEKFRRYNQDTVDYVIGPGYGAITLADRLATSIFLPQGKHCESGFTEKQDDGTMSLARFDVKGKLVIPCEDTITTGGSVHATINAIKKAGGIVASVIIAVCNRSGTDKIGDRQIIPLINTPMKNWLADECPLCKNGSEAIRPKKENWGRLTAE